MFPVSGYTGGGGGGTVVVSPPPTTPPTDPPTPVDLSGLVTTAALEAYDITPKLSAALLAEGVPISIVRKNILGSGLFRQMVHHNSATIWSDYNFWTCFNNFDTNSLGQQTMNITKPQVALQANRIPTTKAKEGCWTLLFNGYNTAGVQVVLHSSAMDPNIGWHIIRGRNASGATIQASTTYSDVLPLNRMALVLYLKEVGTEPNASGTLWYYVL